MRFISTSRLGATDLRAARRILAERPLQQLYFEAALGAPAGGLDNRAVLIGADGRGIVLSIDFDAVTVRMTVGPLAPAELATAVRTPRKAELHLEPAHLAAARRLCAPRMRAERTLCYYRLDGPTFCRPDPRCRRLGPQDADRLAAFFRAHYGASVLSVWMLELPFFGLFEEDRLLACGGTVVSNRRLGAANLGNFLTHPDHRGRGHARAVLRSLVNHLEAGGLRRFMLGTDEDNRAARQAYEAVGFTLMEARPQLDLRPA